MRRVVGGDDIDRAILETLDDRFLILSGAQRWVHLELRIVALDAVIGERDVVGGGLGRDFYPARFGAADQVDGVLRRDVLQMNVGAGVGRKDGVAGDDQVLSGVGPALQTESGGNHAFVHHRPHRHRMVLAVVHQRQIEHLGVFAGTAHELVALDAVAVVGDRDYASAGQ